MELCTFGMMKSTAWVGGPTSSDPSGTLTGPPCALLDNRLLLQNSLRLLSFSGFE